MKFMEKMKNMLAVLAVSLCMIFTCVPMMEANAEVAAAENQAPTVEADTEMDDETVFLFMMGGGFLIILFAVVASVASATSAVSACIVAEQFDED